MKTTGAVLALVLTTAVAGCGSSGTTTHSKPAYCGHVTSLKQSLEALPHTNVVQGGVSALETAVTKVKNDAEAVVSSAKSDFPSETSALQSSVHTLGTTVSSVVSSPSASTLAQIPGQVAEVVTAGKNLEKATKSKCS